MLAENVGSDLVEVISDPDQFENSTAGDRVLGWNENWKWICEHSSVLCFGSGVGSWRFVFPEGTGGHNQFLHVLGECGTCGWLAFYSMLLLYLSPWFRKGRLNSFHLLSSHLLLAALGCLLAQESLWPQFVCGNLPLFQLALIAIVHCEASGRMQFDLGPNMPDYNLLFVLQSPRDRRRGGRCPSRRP